MKRHTGKPPGMTTEPPVRLFVSYSHDNATWSKRLMPLLKVKANVAGLRPWHDAELKAGDEWDNADSCGVEANVYNTQHDIY